MSLLSGASARTIAPGDAAYPASLARYLGRAAPAAITACGDPAILQQPLLGLYCSVRCPGEVILGSYDLARALRDGGVAVAGGFQSPMERECLALLLRGNQPVVICLARSLERMRLQRTWQNALSEGRLLLLSPFVGGPRRASTELAQRRNLFVAALCRAVLVAHAAPGGKTATFAATVAAWGLPLLTLDSPRNAALVALGARPATPTSAAAVVAEILACCMHEAGAGAVRPRHNAVPTNNPG